LGQWIRSRGVREEVVILDKGAHSPCCYPQNLSDQLLESLERMEVDYVDIYMMHRDNPQVAVDEFVDVLNAHQKAGRIRVFGASNWSMERIDAFNQCAHHKGLRGFSAVSNNFSLARMVDPIWPGCIASSQPAYRQWHTRTQMPLMPWSSQARGFFVRADPADKSDKEMVRCWYSEDNFKRLERVRDLSAKTGWSPINIALAWVLGQPFPTFPLIGPRTLEETRSSLAALDIQLTDGQMKWLNLEQDSM
jgi:aryl-alcohol dehydrogenase-like predicted oxidoreductase